MNIYLLANILKLLLMIFGVMGFTVLVVIWAVMNPGQDEVYDNSIVHLSDEQVEYLLKMSNN